MEAIKVEHLSFGYTGDVPILEDVNLKIDEGDYVILTGENGSGKSTFLKLVLGQLSPNQGKIELLGRGHGIRFLSRTENRLRSAEQYQWESGFPGNRRRSDANRTVPPVGEKTFPKRV